MKRTAKLFGMILAVLMLLTSVKVDAATDWNSGTITATGYGVPTTGTHGAQARYLARRAAIADAYRQLLEIIKGVQVDSETTVEMMMVTSDIIRTKVSGTVNGARVIDEKMTPDGGYEVTVQIGMFGQNSLADAVIERPTGPAEVVPFPAPQPTMPSAPSVTITVSGGYTGVVIDCRGLGLNPVMSPVIKDASGNKLYGHKNIDPDYVIQHGMASYAHDMSMASRAGSNPLVIKAVSLADHNANPVVSVDDGNLMLLENNSAHFLSSTAVVFLY